MPFAILRIYLKQNATYHGKSVHEAVLEFLRDSGIRGSPSSEKSKVTSGLENSQLEDSGLKY